MNERNLGSCLINLFCLITEPGSFYKIEADAVLTPRLRKAVSAIILKCPASLNLHRIYNNV
jgi:hypothetical protein